MKTDSQQRSRPPIEYWILLGIALRASGLTCHLLFIVVLYFLFKHWQPFAGFSLLTLTSIFVGMGFAKIYYLLILYPQNYSTLRFFEPLIVAFTAGALLFTRRRGLAWLLVVYSALGVLIFFLGAVYHFPRKASPQALFFAATLSFIELWLLTTWIRSQPPVARLSDSTTQDNVCIRPQDMP
jgi:hypothetical protein